MIRFFDGMEYEERYGEEVGTCNKHKVTVVDRSCDLCFDEHLECTDFVSVCCGKESHEYVENFCGACNEATTFECIVCGTYLVGFLPTNET